MAKKAKPWYEDLAKMGIKIDHVTEKDNVVVKKISVKNLKAIREAGYYTKKMPNGSIVILHK